MKPEKMPSVETTVFPLSQQVNNELKEAPLSSGALRKSLQDFFHIFLKCIDEIKSLPECKDSSEFRTTQVDVNCIEHLTKLQDIFKSIKIFFESNNELAIKMKDKFFKTNNWLLEGNEEIEILIENYINSEGMLTEDAFKLYQEINIKLKDLIFKLIDFKLKVGKEFNLQVPWGGAGYQVKNENPQIVLANLIDHSHITPLKHEFEKIKNFNIKIEKFIIDQEKNHIERLRLINENPQVILMKINRTSLDVNNILEEFYTIIEKELPYSSAQIMNSGVFAQLKMALNKINDEFNEIRKYIQNVVQNAGENKEFLLNLNNIHYEQMQSYIVLISKIMQTLHLDTENLLKQLRDPKNKSAKIKIDMEEWNKILEQTKAFPANLQANFQPQIETTSETQESQLKTLSIEDLPLPAELLVNIGEFLPDTSLGALSKVSKRFKKLIDGELKLPEKKEKFIKEMMKVAINEQIDIDSSDWLNQLLKRLNQYSKSLDNSQVSPEIKKIGHAILNNDFQEFKNLIEKLNDNAKKNILKNLIIKEEDLETGVSAFNLVEFLALTRRQNFLDVLFNILYPNFDSVDLNKVADEYDNEHNKALLNDLTIFNQTEALTNILNAAKKDIYNLERIVKIIIKMACHYRNFQLIDKIKDFWWNCSKNYGGPFIGRLVDGETIEEEICSGNFEAFLVSLKLNGEFDFAYISDDGEVITETPKDVQRIYDIWELHKVPLHIPVSDGNAIPILVINLVKICQYYVRLYFNLSNSTEPYELQNREIEPLILNLRHVFHFITGTVTGIITGINGELIGGMYLGSRVEEQLKYFDKLVLFLQQYAPFFKLICPKEAYDNITNLLKIDWWRAQKAVNAFEQDKKQTNLPAFYNYCNAISALTSLLGDDVVKGYMSYADEKLFMKKLELVITEISKLSKEEKEKNITLLNNSLKKLNIPGLDSLFQKALEKLTHYGREGGISKLTNLAKQMTQGYKATLDVVESLLATDQFKTIMYDAMSVQILSLIDEQISAAKKIVHGNRMFITDTQKENLNKLIKLYSDVKTQLAEEKIALQKRC